ncbi:hypothetical protein T03_6182 [Trichinella britovi]|uniref:Uncharacterized protein n=1 Tax=Trichinella britovi TaxID=45882 RepID=A0A0V1C4Q0_TRIBR|nr:hypothetical protein T03_6182 [Trichinella britovi]
MNRQPFCSFYRHAIDNIKPLQDKETRQLQCCQSTARKNKMGMHKGVSKQDGNADNAIFLKKLTAVE